jgi:hypothetical protein
MNKYDASISYSLTHSLQRKETVVTLETKKKKTRLRGLCPRANYTNRTTAACRRSDGQLFADSGCHVVSVTDPYNRILGFLDRSRYFSIKQLLSFTHEAEWIPFQTHYFFFW